MRHMRPADTSAEAWEIQLAVYRAMPPGQKMHMAFELTQAVW